MGGPKSVVSPFLGMVVIKAEDKMNVRMLVCPQGTSMFIPAVEMLNQNEECAGSQNENIDMTSKKETVKAGEDVAREIQRELHIFMCHLFNSHTCGQIFLNTIIEILC